MTRAMLMLLALTLAQVACKRDDMANQPRIKPLRATALFADSSSARTPPAHTVQTDAPLEGDPDNPSWQSPSTATHFPFEITRDDLLRGQQQFTIYCTPCH